MAQDDIQGQVVDGAGNPVSGAIVELTKSYQSSPLDEQVVRRTTTDANGNYIFEFHPDGDGTTQEWHVSCYNHDGTAYVNSFNNPGVTADLRSNAIPDPVTNWTTAGDSGFTISTGSPLSVSHDNEGAGDAGGMASEYVVDLDGEFAGEIVDVEFRNVNFENNSNGNNHLMIGFGDISPDQPARTNGNGIYYASETSAASDTFDKVENGSESRNKITNVDWSSNHDITVRVDDTGSSTTAELLVDGSSRNSRSDMFQSDVTVIFQLINQNSLSNSCNIDEVGIIKQ